MAGGTFDKLAGQIRPGVYVNFESNRNDLIGESVQGVVVVPLINHDYAFKGLMALESNAPDEHFGAIGYSIYDETNDNMLLIREAFKNAKTVIVGAVTGTGVTFAANNAGNLTVTAKTAGAGGNRISYTLQTNVINTVNWDLTIYLDGKKVDEFINAASGNLDGIESNYVTVSVTGPLQTSTGVNIPLTGGTSPNAANADITAFLDNLDNLTFNTLCWPVTESALATAAATKIRSLRENAGRGVQLAVANYPANYEGVINVTNGVVLAGRDMPISAAQATAWVAGATAAAGYTASLTYKQYVGATAVNMPKNNLQAETAISAGEFFFSMSERQEVVVEYDINSLTDFSKPQDKTYRKNRVIRVFDAFKRQVQLNFAPNSFDNSPNGWIVTEGLGKALLKKFEEAGAIKNVNYDADFKVDRSQSSGDECYFNIGLEPTDAAEKLYFTVKTR